jgi:hypothetical protein
VNTSFQPLGEGAWGLTQPFEGSPLLAEGKINLISLDAIALRLGARWAARRDPIYEHFERAVARHVGEDCLILRVSDTGYLVVQPDASRFAAQTRCLSALRDVLTYFLGAARPADLAIREVAAITAAGLQAAPVDVVALLAAADRESAEAAASPDEVNGDQWSPFLASDGRRVRVSCTLQPVLELKGYARIGYRVARRVLLLATDEVLPAAEHSRLTRGDLERIDFATIARGLDRLRSEAEGEAMPSLTIPVSYVSLSNQRGRAVLIGLFKQAQQAVQRGLICEVCDIDGVPQAALLAAISFIKPYCLFVVGRTAAAHDANIRNLRGAGLQGVSIEAEDRFESDAEFFQWARGAIASAKTVAKSVLIYDLPNARCAALAATLGATHASIRPPTRPGAG